MKTILSSLIFLFGIIHLSIGSESTTIMSISKNWNSIESMSGTFHQIDPDGIESEGSFYFLKPYQAKFKYKNRSEHIVTNKKLIRIVDNEGFQIDSYLLGNNILKKILSNNIDIEKEFIVKDLNENGDYYEIELFLDENENNSNAILFFDKKSLDLKKWEIYDEFSNKTVLEFTKTKKNIFISENLFAVKYKQQ